MQQTIDFIPSPSPLNTERLGGQNGRLYKYLKEGNTINCFSEAKKDLKIGYLNSRASDLKKAGIELHKRYIKVKDVEGNEVSVIEYSLSAFKD